MSSEMFTLLEARITLLERQITRLSGHLSLNTGPKKATHIGYAHPGLRISCAYDEEKTERGERFCWVGGGEQLQFIFDIEPAYPMECRLKLQAYSDTSFADAKLVVNNAEIENWTITQTEFDWASYSFDIPVSAARVTSIVFVGVKPLRLSKQEVKDDHRLLAARFFGAEFLPR